MRPLSTTASPSNLGLAVVCTWRPIRFKNELRATSYELRAPTCELRKLLRAVPSLNSLPYRTDCRTVRAAAC